MADIAFFPAGDSAVVVQFGSEIAESVNRRIARFTHTEHGAHRSVATHEHLHHLLHLFRTRKR